MQEMVKNLLWAMGDTIRGLAWMSEATKAKALEKLFTFDPKIGYPDKWKDYGSVRVRRDAHWGNVVAGRRFNVEDDRAQIGRPVDRGRWNMTPPTSNAYDLKKFQERGACVVDQFEGYFIEPGMYHNGRLVLGESIGDLAGAKIAFRAYQLSRRGKPPEPTIDGFTPEQQFFVAWGQFRGDAIRPETQRLMVQTDPHPTGKYRVIGPLSNMPEFQQTFDCKADAPMVRPAAQRCVVW
jgi:predicted metalloendopeptidase